VSLWAAVYAHTNGRQTMALNITIGGIHFDAQWARWGRLGGVEMSSSVLFVGWLAG